LKEEINKGLNLIDYRGLNVSHTSNGLILTNNFDGSFSLVGTATATKNAHWFLSTSPNWIETNIGKGFRSAIIKSNSNKELWLGVWTGSVDYSLRPTANITSNYSSGANFVVKMDIVSGETYNITFYPMLVKGSHAYPYVPYNANKHITNEQATLLKNEYLKSSNLLNIEDKSSTTTNGITYSISNGKITLNGTATSTFAIPLYQSSNTPINTVLCAFNSVALSSNLASLWVYNSNNQSIGALLINTANNSKKYTESIYKVDLGITTGATFTNFILSPMLVEGTTIPTTFEPYHGEIVHKKELNAVENKIVKLYIHDIKLRFIDNELSGIDFKYRMISRNPNAYTNQLGDLEEDMLSISLLSVDNEGQLKVYPLSICPFDSDRSWWIICMINDEPKRFSVEDDFQFISDTVTEL
jgi:hypothetical protein